MTDNYFFKNYLFFQKTFRIFDASKRDFIMTPQNPTACPACHLLVEEADHFCRHCGRSLKPGHGFLYSHTGIILLALVLGPFALPCVWMSKRMGVTAKIIYSVILGFIGYYFVLTCYRIFQLMQEAGQLMLGGNF